MRSKICNNVALLLFKHLPRCPRVDPRSHHSLRSHSQPTPFFLKLARDKKNHRHITLCLSVTSKKSYRIRHHPSGTYIRSPIQYYPGNRLLHNLSVGRSTWNENAKLTLKSFALSFYYRSVIQIPLLCFYGKMMMLKYVAYN